MFCVYLAVCCPGFMTSIVAQPFLSQSFHQKDPHIDFLPQTVDPWYVDESPAARRRTGRGKRLGYKERVPFIAFFPLTPDGMAVEVWEARDDHRCGRPGVLVHIPYGCMMMARGDVVHAGGFSNSSRGNPRCPLYSEYHIRRCCE